MNQPTVVLWKNKFCLLVTAQFCSSVSFAQSLYPSHTSHCPMHALSPGIGHWYSVVLQPDVKVTRTQHEYDMTVQNLWNFYVTICRRKRLLRQSSLMDRPLSSAYNYTKYVISLGWQAQKVTNLWPNSHTNEFV